MKKEFRYDLLTVNSNKTESVEELIDHTSFLMSFLETYSLIFLFQKKKNYFMKIKILFNIKIL